jgi:hypothetical protein
MDGYTDSFVLKFIFRLLAGLNVWYENSVCHRMLAALGRVFSGSTVVSAVTRFFTAKNNVGFAEDSISMRLLNKGIALILKLFTFLLTLFSFGLLGKLWDFHTSNIGYVFFLVSGFFAWRLVYMTVLYGFAANIVVINGGAAVFGLVTALLIFYNRIGWHESLLVRLGEWFFSSDD